MTWLDPIHAGYVHSRRVSVLTRHLAPLLPADATVLDVGAGDGHVAAALMSARPDIRITGIDPLVRGDALIPVVQFDGLAIPYAEDSFDAVLLIDVIHHAADPLALLGEVRRAAREAVIIKDHRRDGVLAGQTLRFMDAVGNRRHGVALPHNYWSRSEWDATFARLGLRPEIEIDRLGLYPWPASLLFDRSLHFIARLGRSAPGSPIEER